ncbi:MAG: FAD:protein FMN transferase [Candidatus Latescibacteria bacterium]|nr:FAD:protein FMN transferase [Candidatus Latescibacterota bacterium]
MRWILIFCLIGFVGCDSEPRSLMVIRGQTMGTTFQVKLHNSGLDQVKLDADINALLIEVNRQMSTYQKDSEITQFNQSQAIDWVGISGDFGYVLGVAQQVSEWSGGAFDVTVGPLVNLWGFGPEAVPVRIPNADSVQVRMAMVGYEKLNVRSDQKAVRKLIPQMYCDLSAIAKGFGVDAVAGYLDRLNVTAYFVEIGGEVRVRGRNRDGKLWRVGIATPTAQGGLQKVVEIEDHAMATSGDYHNYFEKDGKRYSHTIDPRTGHPITHRLASVSVIHKECAYADALATAINVMGPDNGFEFALEQDLPVFLLIKSDNGFEEKMTPAFEKIFYHKN